MMIVHEHHERLLINCKRGTTVIQNQSRFWQREGDPQTGGGAVFLSMARPDNTWQRLVDISPPEARVSARDADLAVGDLLGFDISHPCTTFDKWSLLLEVDDDYTVVGGLKTFF